MVSHKYHGPHTARAHRREGQKLIDHAAQMFRLSGARHPYLNALQHTFDGAELQNDLRERKRLELRLLRVHLLLDAPQRRGQPMICLRQALTCSRETSPIIARQHGAMETNISPVARAEQHHHRRQNFRGTRSSTFRRDANKSQRRVTRGHGHRAPRDSCKMYCIHCLLNSYG